MLIQRITTFLPPLCVCLCVVLTVVSSQQPHTLQYTIQDDEPPGTVLGDIIQDSGLSDDAAISTSGYITFTDLSAPHVELFEITADKVLQVSRKVDRDAVCPSQSDCNILLDLQLQPSTFFQIIKVSIQVNDSNDNDPEFVDKKVTRSISEAAALGTRIPLPSAIDLDSPKYGVDHYSISDDSKLFRLTAPSDSSSKWFLTLDGKLDRETRAVYSIQLTAYDKGQPPRSGSTLVEVKVNDVNDNLPQFDNETYHVTVSEATRPVQTLIQVHAIDRDIGDNGVVVYGFDTQTSDVYGELFSINAQSGVIRITGDLDYEETPSITLLVTATNSGTDSVSNFATVQVGLMDANDNAPDIKVHNLGSNGEIVKLETDSLGSNQDGGFIGHVTVTDKDTGDNALFTCNLLSDASHLILRKMFDTDYVIESTSPLDRESRSLYDVTISCADSGIPRQTSSQRIRIFLGDVNDNKPQFIQTSYRGSIEENRKGKTPIMQVSATDRDAGLNGEVRYKLAGNDVKELVSVDSETGIIKTKVSFDRESFSMLEFDVVAYDLGDPVSLNASVHVIVDVIDVDDNLPTFSQAQFTFWVFEGQSIRSYVGKVNASDPDAGVFGDFEYKIHPSSTTADIFTIDSNTGKLYTNAVLDHEKIAVYRFLVLAESKTDPDVSGVASVLIHVADINDNSPTIEYPTAYNNTVYLGTDKHKGESIAQVLAHDPDEDVNAELSFSIISGNTDDQFDMDPETGVIRVAKSLADYDDHAFGLVVSVRDHGTPPATSEAYFNIIVNRSLSEGQDSLISRHNMTIVIVIATVSGFLVVILLVSIAILLRWPHILACQQGAPKYNYMARKLDARQSQDLSNIDPESGKDITNNQKRASQCGSDKCSTNRGFVGALSSLKYDAKAADTWNMQTDGNHGKTTPEVDGECSLGDTDSGRGSHEDVGLDTHSYPPGTYGTPTKQPTPSRPPRPSVQPIYPPHTQPSGQPQYPPSTQPDVHRSHTRLQKTSSDRLSSRPVRPQPPNRGSHRYSSGPRQVSMPKTCYKSANPDGVLLSAGRLPQQSDYHLPSAHKDSGRLPHHKENGILYRTHSNDGCTPQHPNISDEINV